MKKFLREFKEFAMKGNVLDMAVGVVIGTAFKAIVDSLVDDLLSPILGKAANQDLSKFVLSVGGVDIKYGSFLSAVINFIIMAFVIFLLVKVVSKVRDFGKKEVPPAEPASPTTKLCPYCKSEIPIDATRCGHCTSVLEEPK